MGAETTIEDRVAEIVLAENINGFAAPGGTDKHSDHSYGPVYSALMQNYAGTGRPMGTPAILEIGVQYGGSMLLWQKLCPSSFVFGVDSQQQVSPEIFKRLDPNRYAFLVADAYTPETAAKIAELHPRPFDFIIDDGPHTLASQIDFLQLYLSRLAENGVAVIEDVQSETWINSLQSFVPRTGFVAQHIDLRAVRNRFDDMLFIVRRV